MPPLLFRGRRVNYNSIFCDVRTGHDPANGCLVTDLVRLAAMGPVFGGNGLLGFLSPGRQGNLRFPLTNTYHGGRGSVKSIAVIAEQRPGAMQNDIYLAFSPDIQFSTRVNGACAADSAGTETRNF